MNESIFTLGRHKFGKRWGNGSNSRPWGKSQRWNAKIKAHPGSNVFWFQEARSYCRNSVTRYGHVSHAIKLGWNFLALRFSSARFPRASILRMHTGFCAKASSHVMRELRRVAAPNLRYYIGQRCYTMLYRPKATCLLLGTRNRSWTSQLLLRAISWSPKKRPDEHQPIDQLQDDATKAAILEKVMKGRQPTDLMLRCE